MKNSFCCCSFWGFCTIEAKDYSNTQVHKRTNVGSESRCHMLLESVCHFIGSLLICQDAKALKMMLVVMLFSTCIAYCFPLVMV